jgi:hypothetical protein
MFQEQAILKGDRSSATLKELHPNLAPIQMWLLTLISKAASLFLFQRFIKLFTEIA